MFLTAIAGVVFRQEDSPADHHTQGLAVVHFSVLVVPAVASSVAEISWKHMTASQKSWTGNCMPLRHSPGQSAGSHGYSYHCRCILRRSHLANILLAMSQNAEGDYCIVAKAAYALDVAGGMTWRGPTSVLYSNSRSVRGSFTVVQILWAVACKEGTVR